MAAVARRRELTTRTLPDTRPRLVTTHTLHLPSSQSWQNVDWLNCLWGCTKIQLETNWKIYRFASQTIKSKTLLLHFAELCSTTYYFSYLCDCSRQYTVLCIATTSSTWKVDERRMLEPHSYHIPISVSPRTWARPWPALPRPEVSTHRGRGRSSPPSCSAHSHTLPAWTPAQCRVTTKLLIKLIKN